jgi:hypothetical protein
MKLFDPANHTRKDATDAVAGFAERLRTEAHAEAFVPAAALPNSTNQTFAAVDGVVLSASDAKLGANGSPALKLSILVYRIKDDALDPAVDLAGKYILGSEKVHKPDSMRDDKIAMPRQLRNEVKLVPLSYLEVSLFHQVGKPQPASASLPLGTKVRLSGITASPGKTGEGPIYLNAKAVTVISEVDDAQDGFSNVAAVLASEHAQEFAALAGLPLFGGVQSLVEKHPFLGTVAEGLRGEAQASLANTLANAAKRLTGKAAGEGTPYEVPVMRPDCELEAYADKVAKLAEGASLAEMLGNAPVLQLPMLVEGVHPGEKFPRSLSTIMDDAPSATKTRFVAQTTSVDVVGHNVKVFLKPTLALVGEQARDALSFEQDALTNLPGPALAVKKSLKELAVVFDTRSQPVAEMLVKTLVPHCDIALVAPAHMRDHGDRLFGDGAAGVNWPASMVFDVPSGIRRAGVEVSARFVKEFSGGSDTITELDLDAKDAIPAPTGQQLPTRVALKINGFLAANQRSTNVARLEGPRLPPGKQNVNFFVVFPGCADVPKGPLEDNEAAVRAKYGGGDLTEKLMAETVLYAVAEGESRKRELDESPPTSEPEEGAQQDDAEEAAGGSTKKKKKKKASPQ